MINLNRTVCAFLCLVLTLGSVFAADFSLDGEFVAFDLETTGLSPENDRITEIGAVIIKDGKEIVVEVKEKRKKRSLNANAYFWQLVNKVAQKLNCTDQDVYRRLVKDYGVSTTLMVRPEAQEAFVQIWTEGKDSSGWFCEDLGHGVIKAYSGTSTYNTQQMSRIIDGLVEECKELNIETLSEDELTHMKTMWGK